MPMAVAAIAPSMILECEEYGLPEPELIDVDGVYRENMFRKPAEKIGLITMIPNKIPMISFPSMIL